MDSEVIKEIANQLGIAVESTGQFLEEILPQYAAMNVIGYGIGAFALFLLFVICVSLAAFAFASEKKREKLIVDSCNTYFGWKESNEIMALVGSVGGAFMFSMSAYIAVKAIQWAVTPSAMFFAMILSKVN